MGISCDIQINLPWVRKDESTGLLNSESKVELFHNIATLYKPFFKIFMLTGLVLLSSLFVVVNSYEYRQRFHQYQKLVQHRDDLQVEWGQLLLEQGAWAANNRVEQLAIKKLNMEVPAINQIEIVRYGY